MGGVSGQLRRGNRGGTWGSGGAITMGLLGAGELGIDGESLETTKLETWGGLGLG